MKLYKIGNYIFIFAFLLCGNVCYAQVEGIVRNASDNEVLTYTHVVNLTTSEGVFTDINGFYRIDAKRGDVLQFSYVGYARQNITVGTSSQINVKLKPDGYAISDLTVLPGVNPAHRIINNAIAKRANNNPDNLNTYSCMIYNRLVLELLFDSVANPARHAKSLVDYGFINEAIIKREYKYKGNVSEHIISSITSGAEEYQTMAFLQPMLQSFHFYDDVLEWKYPAKFLLNPISPGSTSKYFFHLRDTIVSGVDSTFIISFQPRRSANFDGLKGLLHINSKNWAVQNIMAEPADYSPILLKLQQSCELIDDMWFPSELSLELFFLSYSEISDRMIVLRGKSRITDVNINPDLSKSKFTSRNITIADDAHKKRDMIDIYRGRSYNARELATFRTWDDHIRRKLTTFEDMFRLMEDFTDNENTIPIKIFSFPIERVIQQNYHEGFRVGLGMYTNRHLSPWFSLGGYYGYGVKDQRSKFGASLSIFPEKHLDSEIKFHWASDLLHLSLNNEIGVEARKLLGKFDIMPGFMVHEFQTLFDYSYKGRDMSQTRQRNIEARLMLRYAHREDRVKMFRRTQTTFTTQPVVYCNIFFGIPDFWGSEYKYLKAEIGMERSWHIRNLGTATYSLWGGWMSHNTPVPLTFAVTDTEQSLFHTRGSHDSRKNFNVLTGDAYAANQYLNFFLYHDFGTLLHKTQSKVFRPRIAIAQSVGWSKLNSPQQHISAELNILDMNKGYFESGIIIEDLIRLEFMNTFFVGLGGGVYGAYGGGVQKSFEKTLTPKIRISASF